MRRITVTAPRGSAPIAEIAFAVGVSDVTIGEKRLLSATGPKVVKDSAEIEVGKPLAKAFTDEFAREPFLTRDAFLIAVRQPHSIISRERLSNLKRSLVELCVDVGRG